MLGKNKVYFIENKQFSYHELGAKLYSYCYNQNDNASSIKIVLLFCESDLGKGSAFLKLFKQFSSFPLDISISQDNQDIFSKSGIADYQGMSIIICALPALASEDKSCAEIPVDLLQRMTELREYVSDKNNFFAGKVVFLSGVNLLDINTENEHFPESSLIPWSLLIRDGNNMLKSYQQPELNGFLDQLDMSSPVIDNLDTIFSNDS